MKAIKEQIEKNSHEYGSIPFWSWNDRLSPEELRRQIRNMKQMKMGGFFMHARGGLETEYMSDEWYECIRACVDEAKKQGMEAWAYDENGWPSGFAGGKLLEDPDNFAVYVEAFEGEDLPVETDMTVASMKLAKTSVSIDKLTESQMEYLGLLYTEFCSTRK